MSGTRLYFLSADKITDLTVANNVNILIFSLLGYYDYYYCDVLLAIDDNVYGMSVTDNLFCKKEKDMQELQEYEEYPLDLSETQKQALTAVCKRTIKENIESADEFRMAFGRVCFWGKDNGMSAAEYVSYCLNEISYFEKGTFSTVNISIYELYKALEKHK